MFRAPCRSSSSFSLTDFNKWKAKSCFTAQASAWCGMASVSGTGFLSKVKTRSTGGFRQKDSCQRRWQSLSYLASDGATQSFPPSPGAELQATWGECSWLQNPHERLDTQLDWMRTRDVQLGHSLTTAQLLDMRDKENLKADTEMCKLIEALRAAETRAKTQEEERQQALQQLQTSSETQNKLLNHIEELNQRLSHTAQNHSEVQEQLSEANNKISQACLEKAILSTQVLKLEGNIKELKAKLAEALCDKDGLNQEKTGLRWRAQIPELHLERTQPGSLVCEHHDHLLNAESHSNKQDQETAVMKEESKALKEVNEKMTQLEMMKQRLEVLQSQIQEITAERIISSKPITDLETKHSQMIREKEGPLNKMIENRHVMKEKCCQLRDCMEVLQLDKQKVQDQCLCLEAKVLEKEEKLHLQVEEYQKQDKIRVQNIEELKVVASHLTEKWQKVALNLQSTQDELEELRKNNSINELQLEVEHLAAEIKKLKKMGQKDKEQIDYLLQHKASIEKLLMENKKESESLLRAELDACQQELKWERSRSQALLHRYKDKGSEAVRIQDKETETDLSESSLLWEPSSDCRSSQNKSTQVCMESSEVQRLKHKLAEKEKELMQKEEAMMILREMEKTEAQIRISAPELKMSAMCAGASELKVENENQLQVIRFKQPIQDLHTTTEKLSKSSNVEGPNPSHCSEEFNLQQTPCYLFPDGIFLAELVDICSPDEDEEEGGNK
uniref:ELKS/Rab6-interacting/CAST family member 1 isoform X2 n=1 Tax=Monopterus albus TaxID=43700 RepID=UPI0009B3745B|nr:ELKS/Rab6-interacting/CAST family member 1-like isoform X2 [Monopterus albus]